MSIKTLQVSELVFEIKGQLESKFRNQIVEGEISNLSGSSSGHFYFTLSDSESSISCAMFRMDAIRNPVLKKIKDGDKVVLEGDINVYQKRGTFQLVARKIIPKGTGDLKEQFEKLKEKLRAEGLFDLESKKKIPKLAKRIAIITGDKSAALADFLNIYKRRSIWMDIIVVPAIVQGDEAPKKIIEALHRIIKFSMSVPEDKKIDLIVLARGGGSLEDLWAFNSEALAYEIFACDIPIISAVGHEIDYSISDFVADLRAETPSAAAELITEEQTKIKERLSKSKKNLSLNFEMRIIRIKNKLKALDPKSLMMEYQNYFLGLNRRLEKNNLIHRLNELTHINDHYMNLDFAISKMEKGIKRAIEKENSKIEKYNSILTVTDPKNVLLRGYTYIEKDSKSYILSAMSFDTLSENTKLNIHFKDGIRTVVAHEDEKKY